MAYETSLNAPSEVNQGEEVSIEANIECLASSGQCSTQTFEIEIDGVVVKSDSYALTEGSSVSRGVGRGEPSDVTLETDEWVITDDWSGKIVFKESGSYTVTLTGTDGTNESTTLTVTGGPEVEVVGCDLSAGRVEVGETFEATATIENAGELDGETVVQLIDGEGEIASETVVVPGGEQVEVSFDVVYKTPGEYDIGIEYSTA